MKKLWQLYEDYRQKRKIESISPKPVKRLSDLPVTDGDFFYHVQPKKRSITVAELKGIMSG